MSVDIDIDEAATAKRALMLADVPVASLKSGVLAKMGGNIRSWRERRFEIKNEGDNWAVIYYDKQDVEKGRFSCDGYAVESFSDEDELKYGEYGIRLQPYDLSRRVWMLKAESLEEQLEWAEAFLTACKFTDRSGSSTSNSGSSGSVSGSGIDSDEKFYKDVFKVALRSTRASYGYFYLYTDWAKEELMLEYMMTKILQR